MVAMRRFIPLALLVAMLALIAAIVLSATPVVAVRTVSVTGADAALARKVQSAAASTVGTPIVRVDTEQLRRDIVKLSPAVKDVDVRRVLPRTLEVSVVPREPVLIWADRGDAATWSIDADGVVFGKEAGTRKGTPVLVMSDDLEGKERATAVAEAAAVLTQIPASLRAKVVGMRVESRDDIRVTLADDREVRWGNASDLALKAAVMARLIKAVPAQVYDVSAPELPTTRTKP